MAKSIVEQRDDLITEQLRTIRESLVRLEGILENVRIAELAVIRASVAETARELRDKVSALETQLRDKISEVNTTVTVLQYQAKRSGAFAGAWISAVISVVVGAAAALLLRHS